MRTAWRSVSSLLALSLLASAVHAGVHVVDISGGGEFTSLPDAVAAAVDGDTILIRPGDYSGQAGLIDIADLGLTLAADGTGPVLVPPILVHNTTTTTRTVLLGLVAHASLATDSHAGLTVFSGTVFAQGCDFLGAPGFVSTSVVDGGPGVVTLFGTLVLKDCIAKGGKGFDTDPTQANASDGGPGVETHAASAAIYGGHLIGGDGGDIFGYPGGAGPGSNSGGPALQMHFGKFLAGALLTGGNGGNGDELRHEANKYAGGNAMEIPGPAQVHVLGNTAQPGAGGFDGNGAQGVPGASLWLGFGASIVADPGPFRDYSLDGPTSEGDSVHLSYSGVPGDTLAIFISTQASFGSLLPGKQGVWHLGSPLFGPYLLAAPTGTLSLNLTVPNVGLGPDDELLLFEQVFVKPASGPALLSSPTTHLIVDGSL